MPRLGASGLLVTCNAPCRRKASVSLDALRLPHDTPFDEIGKRRRPVCKACGRRGSRISNRGQSIRAAERCTRRRSIWTITLSDGPDCLEVRCPAGAKSALVSIPMLRRERGD